MAENLEYGEYQKICDGIYQKRRHKRGKSEGLTALILNHCKRDKEYRKERREMYNIFQRVIQAGNGEYELGYADNRSECENQKKSSEAQRYIFHGKEGGA